ncbi:hypothetical protein EJ05DRAFT_474093 [Pseudovirgaria hyperparasitica]|uniref:Thioesterase family protein n=1 Tax=Pseudovirgaria hyperparasitica TaxID=470096 RepID=A0A6A6WDE3_9PEZI|nr:uncharacterized protein EJ05DRAFT_474093 [Pseudovirgaria hyperparasitica]KAF2760199.1 hypothetical protein EJ05DRAFT_474093 [Pseudovirgaria hyperparasitica]
MAESTNFLEATATTQLTTHTYSGLVPETYSVKGISQGGYLLSLLLRAAHHHFTTTHASLSQPHTISIHASLLRPTPVGRVTISITDTKISRGTSVIHLSLAASSGKESVAAYILQGNFDTLEGVSADTGYFDTLEKVPPRGSSAEMHANKDPNWKYAPEYAAQFDVPSISYADMYVVRDSAESQSSLSRYFTPSRKYNPGNFSAFQIPWLADMPYVPVLSEVAMSKWLATLTMTVEIKRPLPAEGLEWVLCRTSTAGVRNGVADYNTWVQNDRGEVLAFATQVMRVVESKKRSKI